MLFRNILSLIAVLTAAGVPAGCSTTARLTRRQATAHLAQLSRTERQSKVRDDRPQVVRVERDSSDYYLVPVERDGQGEALGTVPIEEVVVVARVRSIPERRGRVTLDFNVELPKELLGRSRSVVITPFLHRQDEQIPLDDIIIRGALFDRVQQRDYWQYTTYLGRFRPDSVRAERAFQRFVKYPYAQDARLDSLIENRTSISYYYSQEVPTEETSRKMLITLRGRVEGLDDSAYTPAQLPLLQARRQRLYAAAVRYADLYRIVAAVVSGHPAPVPYPRHRQIRDRQRPLQPELPYGRRTARGYAG